MAEYIEREAVMKIIDDYGCTHGGTLGSHSGAVDVIGSAIYKLPAADVVPAKHTQCPVCSGQEVLLQDCYNGYSIEIDAEQRELTIWQENVCLAVFSIDYCPNCGAKMDGG